ncbi:MAG: sialidase family protein [Terriglobales bacterium]
MPCNFHSGVARKLAFGVTPTLLAACLLVPAWSQIHVAPNVQVSAARPTISHHEVVIAADPNVAGDLLACSMLNLRPGSTNTAAYVSFDAGRHWTPGPVNAEKWSDDPTCAYGPDGQAYFGAKVETQYPRRDSSDSDELFIFRSLDHGRTWDPVIKSLLANDRPFLVVDNTHGPYRGRLYAAYAERIYGDTPGKGLDNFRNTVRLITLTQNGHSLRWVYERALMHQTKGHMSTSIAYGLAVTSDGHVTILEERRHFNGSHEVEARVQSFRSDDGGETFGPATTISVFRGAWDIPWVHGLVGGVAVDSSSGQFKNRLYAVWTAVVAGRSRVMFANSSDEGASWSAPSAVDDDAASTRASGGPDDFQPAVAVNRDGVVGVSWYDRRDNADNRGYYVRFAASLDGGQTWLPSVRVSSQPNSVPQIRRGFSMTGGDTSGLAADAAGAFHALWVDNRTGVQQVWTAAIQVTGHGR